MIRVFKPTDRDYTSNGDAVIVPIKARVKNNMNGEFFIELTCESKFYKYLDQGNIIITPTPQGEQAFRIDNQLSRKGERITIKARHVFYDAEKLVVADSYAVDLNCEQALRHFNAATDSLSPFTMHSDITSLNSFRCVRKSLAEAIGTVIERWGGYLVRNNWDISVNKSVGRDYGVTIRYAKNLKELTASYDFSGVATKLLPVGKDGILLPELYVSSAKQYSIPYTKVVSIQQDINEDDYSTEEEYQAAVIADLRTQAQALVNKTCIPVITYTLKGNPEKVQDIGDVIEVIDERIGVNITTQVIGYEWDVITEQYASLTFGNFGNTLSGLMAKVNADTKGVVNEAVGEVKTEFKSSINNIYDLLQGSYVLYRGYDILLLDRIPAGTAQNVIKFSKDGISVSSDGINGDFNEVYNIATKKLSVPSISLNGKNLQNTLDDKISYANLKAGNNITITRKGKIITINSTGKNGNTVLAGLNVPADSLGDEHDLYLKLSGANEDVIQDYSEVGGGMVTYEVTRNSATSYNFFQQISGVPSWDHITYPLHGLIDGNTYNVTFTQKFTNGQFYGGYNDTITIGNGEENVTADLYPDNESHDFSLSFIAGVENILTFSYPRCVDGVLIDSTITDFIISGSFVNGIEDIYGKIDGKWEKYNGGETYEAGDHISIENNIISANYSPFTGTTAQQAGAAGLVPAPAETDVDKVLGAGGNWVKNGTKVEANPADNASGTLTKLGIDGTVYEIQGGGGGGSNLIVDAEIYSLDEKQVGVWTDGKPLYQKTFDCGALLNAQTKEISFTEDMETATIIDAFAMSTNEGYIISIPDVVPNYVADSVRIYISKTNKKIYIYSQADMRTYDKSYVTIQYTKTTDAAGSGGFQAYGFTPIIYSTEEREVGVWTDNKPLYAKTFIQQLSGNAGQIDISACGAEMMFAYSGYYDIGVTMLGLNERLNNQYLTYTHVNVDTMQYIDCTNTIASNSTIVVCCLYTKTTDTAGSASYTTLGIPARHYDGNEKIVGTWFGATLYEKTINTTVSPPNSSIDLSSLNINEVVGFEGCSKSSNGDSIPFGYSVASGSQYLVASFEKATSILYISLGSGLSVYNNVYVTIRYTKNT